MRKLLGRHCSLSETWSRDSEWELESQTAVFDPNHPRYLCCCGYVHALTGVRVISGMLCLTVLFELWQFVITVAAACQGGTVNWYNVIYTFVRFLIGVSIAGSVMWAILAQRAELLIPYILLQGTGLAVAFVFCVSFGYIAMFGDKRVGITVLRSYGLAMTGTDTVYMNYAAWLMTGSFAMVIMLQMWLMYIVVACWRYLRDKKTMEAATSADYSPYVVLKPVKNARSLSAEALNVVGAVDRCKKKVDGRSASANIG